jgi:hypothetical protein
MIFFRLRRERQGAIDRDKGILGSTAQHLCCREQPKRDGILFMDLDDTKDNRRRLVIAICPQQQLGGMERVEEIGGR